MKRYTNGRKLPLVLRVACLVSPRSKETVDGFAKAAKGNIKDELTGLYKRGYFNERLLLEILENGRALRDGNPENQFVVGFSDIDDFNRINARVGHPGGNKILVKVADIFEDNCRPGDVIARYGGEEFTGLFRGASASDAENIVSRIYEDLKGYSKELGFPVTLSTGLAPFERELFCEGGYTDREVMGIVADMLVTRADTAMYDVKNSGKNNCRLWTPEMGLKSFPYASHK